MACLLGSFEAPREGVSLALEASGSDCFGSVLFFDELLESYLFSGALDVADQSSLRRAIDLTTFSPWAEDGEKEAVNIGK